MKNKISVIIPTHKGLNDVIDAIKSLRLQTIKPTEIIVIDNASKENIAYSISKRFRNLKIKRLTKNKGVTGGRNAGIKLVDKSSKYVLIFDHDMTADKDMLENLLQTIKLSKEIGIVTPKILYTDNPKFIWAAGTGMNLLTGQVIFRGGKDRGQYEKTEEVQVAPAVMLIKSELLKKIKRFDDIYFATYEDTDFCFRARTAGYKTFYEPQAVAYHKIPLDEDDSNKRLLDRTFWVARNRIIFMKKFGKSFTVFLLIFTPFYFLYYLFLSLKYKKIKPIFEYVKGAGYAILGK